MFLNHISQVTPNQHRIKTDVLVRFPHALKKSVISQILNYLLECSNLDNLIPSTFHMKWFLEVTGQAFALPIEEHQIISVALKIYDSWILGLNLPSVFDQKKNFFYQEIFGHLSLIFEQRKNLTKELCKKHIELCQAVISIFNRIKSKDKDFLSSDSWTYLLNILLGITDSFLRDEGTIIEPFLTKKLSVHMLKILFEIWLISETQDLRSWELLGTLAKDWIHRKCTIIQWSSTTFGLLNRVISILYGSFEGTNAVTISLPSPPNTTFKPSVINITDEKVIFSWEKMLNILGNPNDFTSPKNFYLAMKGIRDIVTLLLRVGNKQDYRKTNETLILSDHPDGNSIIKIFGRWPIEAVFKNKSGFDEGTSVAYSILCDIFTSHQRSHFLEEYLYKFYSFIVYSFENEKDFPEAVCSIINNTETIFMTKLKGLFVLIPYYLKIINKILLNNEPTFKITAPFSSLRRSALLILKTLIPLPNHFNDVNIPEIDGYSRENIQNFQFISTIRTAIINGFAKEIDPENAKIFFWNMSYLLLATINRQSTVVPLIILTLQKFICAPTEIQEKWPTDVIIAALTTLRSFTSLVDEINDCSTQTLPNLITGLSRVIKIHITNLPKNWKQNEFDSVIIEIINLICDFVCEGQWIFLYPNTVNEILQAIGEIVNAKKKPTETKKERKKKDEDKLTITSRVKFIAQITWFKILRIAGNFPLSPGLSNFSTLITEEKIMKKIGFKKNEFMDYIRFYLFGNDKIFTIIEYPFKDETDKKYKTYIIIRDLIGRYSWTFTFQGLPLENKTKIYEPNNKKKSIRDLQLNSITKKNNNGQDQDQDQDQDQEKNKNNLTKKKELEIEFDYQSENIDFFQKEIENKIQSIESLINLQKEIENNDQTLKEITNEEINNKNESKNQNKDDDDEGSDFGNSLRPKQINREDKDFKFNESRLLLSNFGLLSISDKKQIHSLNNCDELLFTLKKLDKCSERLCHSIGVIYIDEGQNRCYNGEGIFENKHGNEDYEDFIRQIGWIINLKKHNGYNGKLDWVKTGKYASYFSNYNTEVIFKVATLLKTEDIELKKQILGSCFIVIVWCNDERHFNPKCIKFNKNRIFFIIKPHPTGLFTVTIEDYTGVVHNSGPLMNNSFLNKSTLINLVRITAINCNYQLYLKNKISVEPYKIRAGVIKEIKRNFLLKLNYDEFYSYLFSGLQKEVLDEKSQFIDDESSKSDFSDLSIGERKYLKKTFSDSSDSRRSNSEYSKNKNNLSNKFHYSEGTDKSDITDFSENYSYNSENKSENDKDSQNKNQTKKDSEIRNINIKLEKIDATKKKIKK
ncbi:hypothetical protein M0813_13393 [Anaeramoeba flamelloides]|uniref:Rap-GAP domain-containing protein n=1 Tax=Anaeramoeba flamelloides TaxID=1746091 RepID=A0ABQ8Z9G7_9EUKA|nr:hypothetical protein M0813_13393 [Anaeramoeba flamelloides]